MSKPAFDKVPAVNKTFIGEASVIYGRPEGVVVNLSRFSDTAPGQQFQPGQVILIDAARCSIVFPAK